MTTNRLAKSTTQPTRSAHEEADRMNAYGRGQIAGCKGEFIDRPRHDVHWVVRDGRCVIEWVDPPQGQRTNA